MCKATGPVADKLAAEYTANGKTVVFLEHYARAAAGISVDRKNIWLAAFRADNPNYSGSIYYPLTGIDTGFKTLHGGTLGGTAELKESNLRAAIDAALDRSSGLGVLAYYRRDPGDPKIATVTVWLSNGSGTDLGPDNSARVWAMLYEDLPEGDPVRLYSDWFVRAGAMVAINPVLKAGSQATYKLDVIGVDGMDWSKSRMVVVVDYVPVVKAEALEVAFAPESLPPTATPTSAPTATPSPTSTFEMDLFLPVTARDFLFGR